MPKTSGHKWQFKTRFRQHAFGWKSQPAIVMVREAVSEIRQVAKTDPVHRGRRRGGVARKAIARARATWRPNGAIA